MALAWFVELACDHAGVARNTWPELPQTEQIRLISEWQTHVNAKVDFVKMANFKEPSKMDQITNTANLPFEDFVKFDIRVGTITKAEAVPKSKKLLRLEVFFGAEVGSRVILAGIANSFDVASLVSRQVIAVLNLAPRMMMGIESHGMLLAAPTDDASGRVSLLAAANVADGTKVG